MRFVITKNDGGQFHWTRVGHDGARADGSAAMSTRARLPGD
jgi:hypothetical protein